MRKKGNNITATETMLSSFLNLVYFVLVLCCGGLIYGLFGESLMDNFKKPEPITSQKSRSSAEDDWDRVENGIHIQSGLVYAEGFDVVRGTCTACHSAKLVTQNRATREGWKEMIVWMQETQGLWDLGKNEGVILDYLAEHYAPQEIERRPGLDQEEIEWFILNLDDET